MGKEFKGLYKCALIYGDILYDWIEHEGNCDVCALKGFCLGGDVCNAICGYDNDGHFEKKGKIKTLVLEGDDTRKD